MRNVSCIQPAPWEVEPSHSEWSQTEKETRDVAGDIQSVSVFAKV